MYTSSLNTFPGDPSLLRAQAEAKETVDRIHGEECKGAKMRARALFYTAHEKPTRRFFALERSRVNVPHPFKIDRLDPRSKRGDVECARYRFFRCP